MCLKSRSLQQIWIVITSKRVEAKETLSMKFITVILIIATVSGVVVTADVADKIIDKLPSEDTAGSQRSIESLLKTLTKLVEGVIDGDKFILNILRLPEDLALNDIQSTELSRLVNILNDINKKL